MRGVREREYLEWWCITYFPFLRLGGKGGFMASSVFVSLLPSLSVARSSLAPSSTFFHSLQSFRHPCSNHKVRCFAVRRLPVLTFPDAKMETRRNNRINNRITPRTEPLVKIEEKFGITVDRNPSEYRLADLRVWTWHKWECEPSKFPWKYEAQETCYLLKGKAKVYPEGSTDFLEINSGDLLILPKGLSCIWDVSVGIDKFYRLHTSD